MPRATEYTDEGKAKGSTISSDGTRSHFVVENYVEVNEGERKRLVFQCIKFTNGRRQYRLGYYTLGSKDEWKGKWRWARSTPLVNPDDFAKLLLQATEAGWYPARSEA